MNYNMEDIEIQYIRYSQACIYPFSKDDISYMIPLEVIRIYDEAYVCLDNQRLYADKMNNKKTIKCNVYELTDSVSYSIDNDMDKLIVVWVSYNTLHRLYLKANTMEGVMIAQCVRQNTHFSKNGEKNNPSINTIRSFDKNSKQIFNVEFVDKNDINFFEKIELYVQADPKINIYHERSDLQHVILTRRDIFKFEKYEQCVNFYGWENLPSF